MSKLMGFRLWQSKGLFYDSCKTIYDINEKLKEEACGEAYYELKIED